MTDMSQRVTIFPIAHIRTDFPEKFGIPRQSNLVPETTGRIIFEVDFRDPLMLTGIGGFEFLWLLWGFQGTSGWSKTVRPPRLGGKETVGVFASRSPYRPNPIGLSSVRFLGTEETENGTELIVSGADLRDHTPIYDIKPYIAYADSRPDARSGFASEAPENRLVVEGCENLPGELDREAVISVLRQDPRPAYHDDPDRVYGLRFGSQDVHFTVCDGVVRIVGES